MHWLGHTVDCMFSRILPCNPKFHYYSHFEDDKEVQLKYATSPRSHLCIVEDLSVIKRIKRKVGFTVNPAFLFILLPPQLTTVNTRLRLFLSIPCRRATYCVLCLSHFGWEMSL